MEEYDSVESDAAPSAPAWLPHPGPLQQAVLHEHSSPHRQAGAQVPTTGRGDAVVDVEIGSAAKKPDLTPGQGIKDQPCRTLGLRRRHARQLRRQDRDQNGVPVPSTSRPYSLCAGPSAIAQGCLGLGMYFYTIKWLCALALLLSVVYMYPLVDNLGTQGWAARYTLQLGSGAMSYSCLKPWRTTSFVTRSTVGAYCSDPRFASAFDCAATCSADDASAGCPADSPPQLQAPPPPGAPSPEDPADAACTAHQPCGDGGAAAAGCGCCTLAVDAGTLRAAHAVPTAQLATFLVGQALTGVWIAALLAALARFKRSAARPVLSASRFSVLLRGKRLEDGPLADWARQYGPVAACAVIPAVGGVLRWGREAQVLRSSLAESAAQQTPPPLGALKRWLFRCAALGCASHARLAARLARAERRVALYSQPRHAGRPTGSALVTFEYAAHADAAIAHGGAGGAVGWVLDAAHGVVGCCCRCCGAGLASGPAGIRLAGSRVRVSRAPEPSDIIWRHAASAPRPGALAARRALSLAATALIAAAGAAAQYGLCVAAEAARRRRVARFYLDPSLAQGISFDSWAAFAASAGDTVRLSLVSATAGLAVVVVNLGVTAAVRQLTLHERWPTHSATHRWLVVRLAAAYCFNAFAVPVLAAYASGNRASWFSRGGLVESAFWTQLANAIVLPLASLFDPGPLTRAHALARWARTQAALDALLAPPPFPLAEQAANAVMVLALALWWGPVLPLSPMLGTLGLAALYWADKWVALRRCAAPANSQGAVDEATGVMLRALPLVQLVLMRYLYFQDHPAIDVVFWVGLALWLALSLVPLHTLVPRWLEGKRCAEGASDGVGPGAGANSPTAVGMRYSAVLGGGQRGGVEDTYIPAIPAACPPDFTRTLQALFRPEGYGAADQGLVPAPLAPSPGRPAGPGPNMGGRGPLPTSGSFRSPGRQEPRGGAALPYTHPALHTHAEEAEGEEDMQGVGMPSEDTRPPSSSSPNLLTPRGSVLLQSQSWLWEPSTTASAIFRMGGAGRVHSTPVTGVQPPFPHPSPARGPLGMAASRTRLFAETDLP